MTVDVVVTDQAFGGVDRERALAERLGLSFAEHQCHDEADTIEAVRGARVAFVNFAPVTRPVLAALAPRATVIRYGVGVDNVDLDAARELGVAVCNVPDYGVATVADHTVALLLTLLRRIVPYDRAIRDDGWLNAGDLGPLPAFADTTVGMVGSGRIGRAVIERLRPFGFRIVVHDQYVADDDIRALGAEPATLDEVLTAADALTVHVPLTRDTHHLIDAAALSRMPRHAVLVNTARGGLVDEEALADALRSDALRGAALDVVEDEPLPASSPLRDVPGLLLTPHAAFFSDGSLAALQQLATDEAENALTHRPLRCRVV